MSTPAAPTHRSMEQLGAALYGPKSSAPAAAPAPAPAPANKMPAGRAPASSPRTQEQLAEAIYSSSTVNERAAALRMSGDDLKALRTRGAADEVRNMTPAQVKANRAKAMTLLRSEFGDQAPQALAAAQRLIARDPKLMKALEAGNLGDDPQTVLRFARLARRKT